MSQLFESWEREQEELRRLIREAPCPCRFHKTSDVRTVAGIDASYIEGEEEAGGVVGISTLVVLRFPELEVIYTDEESMTECPEYRSGFLYYREGPSAVNLLKRAEERGVSIDVAFVDGFGSLHPRGVGYATQLGYVSNVATVGVGKSLLEINGLNERRVKAQCREMLESSACSGVVTLPLIDDRGVTVGAALSGHASSVRPIYVSAGTCFPFSKKKRETS